MCFLSSAGEGYRSLSPVAPRDFAMVSKCACDPIGPETRVPATASSARQNGCAGCRSGFAFLKPSSGYALRQLCNVGESEVDVRECRWNGRRDLVFRA